TPEAVAAAEARLPAAHENRLRPRVSTAILSAAPASVGRERTAASTPNPHRRRPPPPNALGPLAGDGECNPTMSPRVLNVPPSAPFLPTLIDALTSGKLGFPAVSDPLALAAVTLYLPTRRACRLARDAFLEGLKAEAAILPRIVPIGDIDE